MWLKITKQAVHKTQVHKQVQKKSYIIDLYTCRQTDREGMCVGNTEAIIGKAPRFGLEVCLFVS